MLYIFVNEMQNIVATYILMRNILIIYSAECIARYCNFIWVIFVVEKFSSYD